MTEPRRAASIALVREGSVLLVKRGHAPYKGLWTFPGGRAEPGETDEACVCRELFEELQLTLGAIVPVMVQTLTSASGDWRLSVFATRDWHGTPVPSDEIADWAFVAPAALAHYRTTSRLDSVIAEAFARLEQS